MIREEFGVHFTQPERRPRKERTTRGDNEKPKIGRPYKIFPNWDIPCFCIGSGYKAIVDPENDKCCPAGETVSCLEIIMERSSEGRVGCSENRTEHNDDNVAEDEIGYVGSIAVAEPVFCGEGSVKQEPDDCSGTSPTVNTSIMENLGQATPNGKGESVWG